MLPQYQIAELRDSLETGKRGVLGGIAKVGVRRRGYSYRGGRLQRVKDNNDRYKCDLIIEKHNSGRVRDESRNEIWEGKM